MEKQQWDTTRDIGSGIMEMLTDAVATKQSPPKNPWDCFTMGSYREEDIQSLSASINSYFRWNEMNTDTELDTAAKTFDAAGNVCNTIVFHTMQRHRNTKSNCWEISNLNTGHFGDKGIYEGVKKVRCGFLSYFEPPPMTGYLTGR